MTATARAALTEFLRSKPFQLAQIVVYETFGIPIRVSVCPDMVGLPEYNAGLNPFCKLMNSKKLGLERCSASGAVHTKKVLDDGKPAVYHCHAGMAKIMVPVYAGNEMIAVLTATEALDRHPTEKMFNSVWRKFSDLGIPKGKLREAYFVTPVVTRKYTQGIMALLQLIAQVVVESEARIPRFQEDSADAVIQAVREFIEKEFARPLRLRDIAHQVHLSPVHLSRLFKRNTGLRLWDFLTQARVQEAKKLLWSTERKIFNIAVACGFKSATHFGRAFRSKTGLSPRAYRAMFSPRKSA